MTIYKLPLDDILDKDIIDWIASFPRNRKAEYVRQVLRNHIHNTSVPIGEVKAPAETVEQKVSQPTAIEETKEPVAKNIFSKLEDNMDIVTTKPKDLDNIF